MSQYTEHSHFNFHIRAVHLDINNVSFIHQLMN